jgi:hypothetical protein
VFNITANFLQESDDVHECELVDLGQLLDETQVLILRAHLLELIKHLAGNHRVRELLQPCFEDCRDNIDISPGDHFVVVIHGFEDLGHYAGGTCLTEQPFSAQRVPLLQQRDHIMQNVWDWKAREGCFLDPHQFV